VYVSATNWALGTKVGLTITGHETGHVRANDTHAVDTVVASLGTAIADDTGKIGDPTTIPTDLEPGTYAIVLSGFNADGTAQTQTHSVHHSRFDNPDHTQRHLGHLGHLALQPGYWEVASRRRGVRLRHCAL
jgi:hypothetical protein